MSSEPEEAVSSWVEAMNGQVCRFCGRPAKVMDLTYGQDPLYGCGEWCTASRD